MFFKIHHFLPSARPRSPSAPALLDHDCNGDVFFFYLFFFFKGFCSLATEKEKKSSTSLKAKVLHPHFFNGNAAQICLIFLFSVFLGRRLCKWNLGGWKASVRPFQLQGLTDSPPPRPSLSSARDNGAPIISFFHDVGVSCRKCKKKKKKTENTLLWN